MGRPKKGSPRVIPTCHPEKLHQALGLCSSCYHKQARIKTPVPYSWGYHLWHKYKMTVDGFKAMLEAQNGHCKLCNMVPDSNYKAFCVDHDHTTGKVRGILCKFCNSKLGWYENRRQQIEDYLK